MGTGSGSKPPCRRPPCGKKAWNYGLCHGHVELARRAGELPPARRYRPAADVLDDWHTIATSSRAGTTTADIARRMGLDPKTLRQVLCRARRRGDERALSLRTV